MCGKANEIDLLKILSQTFLRIDFTLFSTHFYSKPPFLWGNHRAQTYFWTWKSFKIRKNLIFLFFVKMLEIDPDGFKSVPKHPPKLKTHVRHPECVIWKFYSLWKIHIFGASEGFFEFLLISSKSCKFWLICKFNRLFWYKCLDQMKQGEC